MAEVVGEFGPESIGYWAGRQGLSAADKTQLAEKQARDAAFYQMMGIKSPTGGYGDLLAGLGQAASSPLGQAAGSFLTGGANPLAAGISYLGAQAQQQAPRGITIEASGGGTSSRAPTYPSTTASRMTVPVASTSSSGGGGTSGGSTTPADRKSVV